MLHCLFIRGRKAGDGGRQMNDRVGLGLTVEVIVQEQEQELANAQCVHVLWS